MGVFKLTFLTVGSIGLAMMHFGRDEGLPADRLGLEPQIEAATIEPVSASLQKPVFVASAPEVRQANVTKAAYRAAPKITPPDPNSAAGRAVAAAMNMAKSSGIKATAAAPVSSEGGFSTRYVTASAVNLRAGPSTRHGKLGRVTRGMAVVDMGPAGPGWSQIKVVDTGQRAFIASKFLSASR